MMAREHFNQPDFGLVELPPRGDETAILVAVGIAEHDFLDRAAAIDQFAIFMQRQQPIHDPGGCLEIPDGFEQRHDVDCATPGRDDEADFLQQQSYLKHVRYALAHRDNALWDYVGAKFNVRFGGRAEYGQFAERLFAVFHER